MTLDANGPDLFLLSGSANDRFFEMFEYVSLFSFRTSAHKVRLVCHVAGSIASAYNQHVMHWCFYYSFSFIFVFCHTDSSLTCAFLYAFGSTVSIFVRSQSEMFGAFLKRVQAVPARSAGWANKAGPVAVLGCDYSVSGSANTILDAAVKSSPDADYYAQMVHHHEGSVDVPSDSSAIMPVYHCGAMQPSADGGAPTSSDWYNATLQSVTDLSEKGYIPMVVGGDGSATLPIVEAIKKVHADEEIILLHFSASPSVADIANPIRVVQEKGLVKGVISVANRRVSAADRKVRKDQKMFYLDNHALFSKGLFCVRDLRNDFPVYISIDVGCLDPAFAPGALCTESGGLTTREMIHLLHGIRAPKILGIDIHGYDPSIDVLRRDGTPLTTFATSKIFKEAVLKAYSVSTATQDEGLARVQMMQRQGSMPNSQYPEH